MSASPWDDDEQDSPTTPLSEAESWDFLGQHEFGRLAFHLVGEVHITPINYCVDGQNLVFRTAQGSKLLAMYMNDDVAFETDQVRGLEAISVIVRGRARILEGSQARRAEELPLRPWVGTAKHIVVSIEVSEITGIQFRLAEPHTA